MVYQIKNFDKLLGIKGFSDNLLKNHFTLYQGYVNNVNAIADLSEKIKIGSVEYSELKRRFAWEWNGMKLHELYFENLTKKFEDIGLKSKIYKKISERFGSYEKWEEDFKFTGKMRGIGWVALVYDSSENRLFNIWVGEHDVGHLVGLKPLLIMDVFEHAYMLDYGLKKADYIESFFKSIDWKIVEKRLGTAF